KQMENYEHQLLIKKIIEEQEQETKNKKNQEQQGGYSVEGRTTVGCGGATATAKAVDIAPRLTSFLEKDESFLTPWNNAIDPIDEAGSRVQLQHAHCNENQMDQPSVCRKRNSKLKAIPNLLNDLQIIYKMELKAEVKDDLLDSSKEESQGNSDGFGGKKRRAQSNHIAKIALPDLVKYFDVPIVEALRNLNIRLTVLKRKCR
ncbi:hypothetical protein S83_066125, partial [Arachis hypogaea]